MGDFYDNITSQTDTDIPAGDFIQPDAYDSEPVNDKNHKGMLPIILMIAGAVIVVGIAALILFRGPIHYRLALNYISNNDYEAAAEVIESSKGDKAEVLSEYIVLRVEFNEKYRGLLENFDEATITEWYTETEKIKENYDILPDDVRSEIDEFQGRLGIIKDSLSVYSSLRYDIIDMMDVFGEINRLIATDENGEKTPFTVNEVLSDVDRWETICGNLSAFSKNLPNGDSIYLLSYLINETYGECTEIKSQMQSIIDEGHGADEEITSEGEGQEQFASITNSNGVTLNVTDPEVYEQYMYADICTALAKYLSVYYYGE